MQKTIVFTLFLVVTYASFSQQNFATKTLSHNALLKKSETQKTVAWLLVGGGTAAYITSVIMARSAISSDLGSSSTSTNRRYLTPSSVVYTSGLILAASSIPFFIMASHNKHKAMAVIASFKIEEAPVIQHASFISQSYPALSIRINIK